MHQLRKVGLETGQLTDEEIKYIDTAVVETVYPLLIGRQIFPRIPLPDAGYLTYQFYRESDMSAATISMTGETQLRDRLQLVQDTVKLPVISKDFKLHWRDILAARRRNEPLDVAHVRNAARQVAEEEDKLLLSGETLLFPALGIKSFTSTITNKNTEGATDDWATAEYIITDFKDAMEELYTDGYYGPYAAIMTPAQYLSTLKKYTSERSCLAYIKEDMFPPGSQVYISPSIYAEDDGLSDSAILCQPGADNFAMLVAQDVTTYLWQDEDMNILGKVYEVVAPIIRRPASICELTTVLLA